MEVVAVARAGLEVVGTVVAVIPEGAVGPVHTLMMVKPIINQLDQCVGGGRDGTSRLTEIILGTNHLKRNSESSFFFFLVILYSFCSLLAMRKQQLVVLTNVTGLLS